MSKKLPDWKEFERLVAAVHRAMDLGAEVRWNDKINGRQFDVIIRFKKGLYDYLTVIECRDSGKTPVPVSDVEAFVTKTRDVHANHAVIASSVGFQKGAKEVAERHKIELLVVTESSEIEFLPFGAKWGAEVEGIHIESVELIYKDGEACPLPFDSGALEYYGNQIVIRMGSKQETLDQIVTNTGNSEFHGLTDQFCELAVQLPNGATVVAPPNDEIRLDEISQVRFKARRTMMKTIDGPTRFDLNLLAPDVLIENLSTGASHRLGAGQLPLGIDTVFNEGSFYVQPNIGHYFYCEKVNPTSARILLIESYQLGILFQAELVVPHASAPHYVLVDDQALLPHLLMRLAQLRAKQQRPS